MSVQKELTIVATFVVTLKVATNVPVHRDTNCKDVLTVKVNMLCVKLFLMDDCCDSASHTLLNIVSVVDLISS